MTTTIDDSAFNKALEFLSTFSINTEKPKTQNVEGIQTFLHKCSDGNIVVVTGYNSNYPKMEDSHLLNTIKYLRRSAPSIKRHLQIYEEEAQRRGLQGV